MPKELTEKLIFELHRLVMKNLSASAGHYQWEPWAIFNQAGMVVYLAPPFSELPRLMKEMMRMINNLDQPAPVKAGLSQFILEKIHPFADGNGRVGRLLSSYFLKIGGFNFRGLVSFEEFIVAGQNTQLS